MSYTFIKDQVLLKGFLQALPYFTGAFDLNNYYRSEKLMCIIWAIIIGYLILHLLLFMFVLSSKLIGKNHNQRIIRFMGILYLLHARVLFFPINFFFMNIAILWGNRNLSISKPFYSETGIFIVTVFGVILNSSFAILKEFILYQTNMSRCAYAAKTNIYSQIIIVNKILGTFLYLLTENNDSVAIIDFSLIIYLLFSLLMLYVLYVQLPFYKLSVLKISVIMNALIISFALLSLIQAFVTNVRVLGGTQVFFFLLPVLLIKGIFIQFKILFEKILKGSFRSPGHGIQFALLLVEFLNENNKISSSKQKFLPDYLKFIGVLSSKGIDVEKLRDKKSTKEFEQVLFKLIIERLKLVFDSFPKSQILSIFMAQIYIRKLDNVPKALELIRKLENRSLSLSMSKTIQVVYLELETNYARKNKESEHRLQLTKYVECSSLTISMKENILKEIANHSEFWQDINQSSLDLKKVADKVKEIDHLARNIKTTCENNLEQFSKNFSLPILVYAVYLNLVRSSHTKSMEFIKKFQSLLTHQSVKNEFDIYSETAAAALISLDKVKAGEILSVSGSIQNLYNINKEELIGQKFLCLFPNIISQKYQRFIQKFAKSLEYKIDEKQKTYGQSANGGFFEMEVHFQLYPYLNHEVTLMIMMTKISEPEAILFIDQTGNITCCSKSAEEKFKQESININSFKIMQDLIIEFPIINKAFNMAYSASDKAENNEKGNSFILDKSQEPTQRSQEIHHTETKRATILSCTDEDGFLLNSQTKRSIQSKQFCKEPLNIPSSFLKPFSDEFSENLKTQLLNELTLEKAQEICNKFMRGKRVTLSSKNYNMTPRGHYKRKPLQADIQIKPYILEGKLYKVLTVKNIHREIQTNNKTTIKLIDMPFSDFAEEFLENEEKKPNQSIPPKGITIEDLLLQEEELSEEETEKESKLIHKRDTGKENLRNVMIEKFEKDDQKSSIINSDKKE